MPANRRILHGWIAKVVLLLQQMNPQHGSQRIRRATALVAGFGVVGLDQVDQCLPWHNRLHFLQKLLTPVHFLAVVCS